MRLLFIHGIAQQDYSEEQLCGIWTDHLLDHGVDPDRLRAAKPEMAYYGKELYQWTSGGAPSPIPMGPPVADQELAFFSKAMDEIAAANHFDEAQIEELAVDAAVAEGAAAIAQSTWLGRRAVAIVSLLEQISPLRGRIAAKVVRQAYIYLANTNARKAIDDLVRPRLGLGDVVVVSHSLGTVVAFNLLRELSDAGVSITVPLFVTLGSPLGIREVQRWVGGTFGVPNAVGTWMSFYDKGDPVTLGRPLSTHFAAGIVDTVVDNNTDNGHSIAGYLDDIAVINPINMAL